MRLHVILNHDVTVLTDTLCDPDCRYGSPDYPYGYCDLFRAQRQASESEGVAHWCRVQRCKDEAK